jgi:hypothetical protein
LDGKITEKPETNIKFPKFFVRDGVKALAHPPQISAQLLTTNPACPAILCTMLAVFAILTRATVLCAGASRFNMSKAIYSAGEEEGADGQEEESFHNFRFNSE